MHLMKVLSLILTTQQDKRRGNYVQMKQKQQALLRSLRNSSSGWMLMSPAMIFLFIFVFIPAVYVFYLSFVRWNMLDSTPRFVGFSNYSLMFQDPTFIQSFLNTVLFSLGMIVISLPIALLLAMLVDMGLKGTKIYRTVIFGPYVIPLVGSGLVWALMYNPNYGFINQLLSKFHMYTPNWLGSQGYALLAVLIMSVWQSLGYYMIIFLGGLQTVSESLKEAAAIDGAKGWQTFRSVIIPSLSPSILFALVVCTIQSFQTFDQVYVMTEGGPDGASSTLVYYIFSQGFQMYNIGIATAASVILLLFLAILTWVQIHLSNRWVVEE